MTLADDYQTIRNGAAVATVSERGVIAVSGRDRAAYLQGLLTNDILAVQPRSGCYAAWLTAQGRMTTDMHVLESGEGMVLDVPASVADAVAERLEQFVFSEDVQIANVSGEVHRIELHGPGAAGVIARVCPGLSGLDGWPPYRNERYDVGGDGGVVARIDQLGVPGFTMYVPRAAEASVRQAIEAHGARTVSREAVDAARIESGFPLFGVDMDDDTIPLEAGIEGRAISLSKGCYVGQEVIIRVLHRGHGRVVKKLVGLQMEGDQPPDVRTRLFAQGKDVGWVTSVARSPQSGLIGLAYVHRDFVEPGSVVSVGDTAERRATVRSLPFRTAAE